MAIAVSFTQANMTAAQFDEALRRLEAIGLSSPPGRLHHVAFGTPDNLGIFDVWESQEALATFAESLRPILADVGIDPGPGVVSEVYYQFPT